MRLLCNSNSTLGMDKYKDIIVEILKEDFVLKVYMKEVI